jgi:hypothetical protein
MAAIFGPLLSQVAMQVGQEAVNAGATAIKNAAVRGADDKYCDKWVRDHLGIFSSENPGAVVILIRTQHDAQLIDFTPEDVLVEVDVSKNQYTFKKYIVRGTGTVTNQGSRGFTNWGGTGPANKFQQKDNVFVVS